MKKVYKTITALLLVCIMVIPGSLSVNAATVAIATNYATLKTAIENKTDTIVLANDITLEDTININYSITLVSFTNYKIYSASGKRHFNVSNTVGGPTITIKFQDVKIDGNYLGGGLNIYGDVTIENAVIQNCNTMYGGAIVSRGPLTFNNCNFVDNHSNYGGAVYATEGLLTTNDCTFTNNTATYYGGAIISYTNASIKTSTFTGNIANKGGAIYLANHGTQLTISWSTISNNSAGYGGGIFNNGTLFFDYTSIGHNAAGYNGGGIFNTSSATYSSYYGAVNDNSPNNIVTN